MIYLIPDEYGRIKEWYYIDIPKDIDEREIGLCLIAQYGGIL
jgi:hypothetical protein